MNNQLTPQEELATQQLLEVFKKYGFNYRSEKGIAMSRDLRDLLVKNTEAGADVQAVRAKLLNPNVNKEGEECPCCDQLVRWYPRPIHSMMARCLISLYNQTKMDKTKFKHVDDIVQGLAKNSGDFAKLAYWGLIEQDFKTDDESHKKTSGRWRITEKGIQFVRGQITVPKHVRVYNGKSHGYINEQIRVTIKDCLGNEFNYTELMAA